jgi:TRAP-type uncharacterized transport system fused permease subunit
MAAPSVGEQVAAEGAIAAVDDRDYRRHIVRAIAIAFSLFQLYVAYWPLDPIYQRIIHIAFGFGLIFLVHPSFGRSGRVMTWDGLLLAGLVLAISAYALDNFHARAWDVGAEPPLLDLVLGGALIVLTIEAARRVVGLGFALLTVTVLFYARFGEMFPSVLFHKDYDLERIITGLFMTTEGVYGLLTGISATFIFVFVLFGAMLRASGAGDFFIQFASSLFGHVRGGPAKIAVVASSLFAMVSSSGLANAAASGQLTIPLMKEAGYKRHFAAAVEAVSSLADITLLGARLNVDHFEPAIDQLVDGSRRARIALLVDLVEQPRPDLLGLGRSAWAGRNRPAQVHPTSGEWVDPGVHGHSERAGRQRLNPPASPLPRGSCLRHGWAA